MIVLHLPFPPSTNNLFINGSKGRFRSQKYADWIAEAGWELQRQRPPKVLGPVDLVFHFQDGRDNRKRDVTNLIKAPEDLLVKHGIIEADDNTIVRSVSAYWADTAVGVEISIFPVASASSETQQGNDNHGSRTQQQRATQGDS
jgi:Holliday junction resolvase RusA-like endonuclease